MGEGNIFSDEVLSVADVSKKYGLSKSLQYKLMDRGELAYTYAGRNRAVPVRAIEAYLRKGLRGGTEPATA